MTSSQVVETSITVQDSDQLVILCCGPTQIYSANLMVEHLYILILLKEVVWLDALKNRK